MSVGVSASMGLYMDKATYDSLYLELNKYDPDEDGLVGETGGVISVASETQENIVEEGGATFINVDWDTGATNLGAAQPVVPSGFSGSANVFRIRYSVKTEYGEATNTPKAGLYRDGVLEGVLTDLPVGEWDDFTEITADVASISAGEVFRVKITGSGTSGGTWVYIKDFEICGTHTVPREDLVW